MSCAETKEPQPCRSPYCECDSGKCRVSGFFDARHCPRPKLSECPNPSTCFHGGCIAAGLRGEQQEADPLRLTLEAFRAWHSATLQWLDAIALLRTTRANADAAHKVLQDVLELEKKQ